MARTSNGNYNALAWVQDEVQQTLADALHALTAYIDDPENDEAIEQCITHIYQVSGTLEMLSLRGAQLLSNELLSSAKTIRDNKDGDLSAIQDSILKGLLILPNYLKTLNDDLQDHPLFIIAILNELRNARGDDEFKARELFSPNLAVVLPSHIIPDPQKTLPTLSISTTKLSYAFQYSLLHWFKEEDDLSLKRMSNIARYLRLSCIQERSIILWWAAEGVIEGLLNKGLPVTPQIKLLVGKLTIPIKLFTLKGEQEFLALFPSELTQDLLLEVARSRSSGDHVDSLKEIFNLHFFDPQKNLKIYNLTDNALPDVHFELVNQIQEIKEGINRYHEQNKTVESLAHIIEQLNNMAGTFALLTDNSTSNLLVEQARQLEEFVSQQQLADDDDLMSLADILLKVEYQLQTGQKVDDQQAIEEDQLHQTVLTECLAELITTKESFVSLADKPENITSSVTDIASQLNLIAGSLTILNLNDAANLLETTAKQLSLMVAENQQLSPKEISSFAEVIASAELYMEGIKQGGFKQVELLERAQNILNHFSTPEENSAEISLEPTFSELDDSNFSPKPEETGVSRYIKSLNDTSASDIDTESSVATLYQAIRARFRHNNQILHSTPVGSLSLHFTFRTRA
ncbi:MAG: hypothetical protein Q9N32_00650 [Gammaproteobacteria bacterium]|nr:hypothetical protein [Gammaproteobacteria bacterium]